MADASVEWQHGNIQCLSGLDLSSYDFISVSKDGFVPISVKPANIARLNNVTMHYE